MVGKWEEAMGEIPQWRHSGMSLILMAVIPTCVLSQVSCCTVGQSPLVCRAQTNSASVWEAHWTAQFPRTHNGQLRASRDILRTPAAREEILHLFHNYLLSSDTGQRRSVEARSAGADKRSHLKPDLYTLFTLGELGASGLDSSLKKIIKIVHIIKPQKQTMCVMQRKGQQSSVFLHYETVSSSCEFLK